MRAAEVDEVRRARRAAIEREVLAHDAQRTRLARRQIGCVKDRLPEFSEIAAGDRAGPRVNELVFHHRLVPSCSSAYLMYRSSTISSTSTFFGTVPWRACHSCWSRRLSFATAPFGST